MLPGKAKVGEGCSCPAEHTTKRDGENIAICKRVPRPAIAPPKAKLVLISHEFAPIALPDAGRTATRQAPGTITPSPPPVTPGPTDADVKSLKLKLAGTQGAARLPILDQIIAALDSLAREHYGDPKRRTELLAASKQLLAEPAFAQYDKADRAMLRHAELLQRDEPAEARKLVQQLIQRYPQSTLIPDARLWLADQAFGDNDLATARAGYQTVAKLGNTKLATYAHYKLGWISFNEAKYLDARQAWEDVVATGDPSIRRQALKDLSRLFVYVGLPDKVFDYFERLDKPSVLDRAREVAQSYLDAGKWTEARGVYRELVMRESEPQLVCMASMGALQSSMRISKRDEISADLTAFAQVASAASGDCKQRADDLLGQVGEGWHREMVKTKGDARDVVAVWKYSFALATEPKRRDAIQRNLAFAQWAHAASAGGGRPGDWVAAGKSFSEIASLAEVAVDAFDNAMRASRGVNQPLAPLTMTLVKGTLRTLGTPRALELLSKL